jgi:hypothetical protein
MSSVCSIDINDDCFNFKKMTDNFNKNNYNYVKTHAKQVTKLELLQNLCYVQEQNNIVLNYSYFKYIVKNKIHSWDEIIQYIVNVKYLVLQNNCRFVVHMNIDRLTLMDIDKYYLFIQKISQIMKEQFPEKMKFCYIYNAPYVFSTLFNIVSVLIDKETQKKIKIIKVD